jgi:carbonyl reductase 1
MMSSSSSTGRVAVVTGGNKGIGYYIAWHLGMSGLFQHVLLGCRDSHRAAQAVESLKRELPSSVSVDSLPLTLGDTQSHSDFAEKVDKMFGKVDCLVNNAGMAFKQADPTPFEKQTKPTLDVNFRGTVDFTEKMLPLLRKGKDARLVNVASMAGRLGQLSSSLQQKFASPSLTMAELQDLVNSFEQSVAKGNHRKEGWSNSNYGMSKLAVIAATKIWAREEPSIAVNACCPGYCKTDMTSQNGLRDPKDGAKNAAIPATMDRPPTGAFFQNYEVSSW